MTTGYTDKKEQLRATLLISKSVAVSEEDQESQDSKSHSEKKEKSALRSFISKAD